MPLQCTSPEGFSVAGSIATLRLPACVQQQEPASMHDALTIGSPLFAVMFGVLLSQRSLDRLEDRMNARFGRIDPRLDRLETRVDSIIEDQSRFFETLASHDA